MRNKHNPETGLAAGNYMPTLDQKHTFSEGCWSSVQCVWEQKYKGMKQVYRKRGATKKRCWRYNWKHVSVTLSQNHTHTLYLSVWTWSERLIPSTVQDSEIYTRFHPPESVGSKLCETLSEWLRSSPEPDPVRSLPWPSVERLKKREEFTP